MNPPSELHAWLDESWHDTARGGLYLLAATMLDPARGVLASHVRVDFAPSSADPLLWVADAVAGAVGASLTGTDSMPLDSLGGSVGVVRITLA